MPESPSTRRYAAAGRSDTAEPVADRARRALTAGRHPVRTGGVAPSGVGCRDRIPA